MRQRWPSAAPFTITGIGCAAAGGLVSAVTAHAPTEQSAWAVAYLVLVAGLAQALLGIGRTLLSPSLPSRRRIAAEVVAWNAGNAAVLVGALVNISALLYSGAACLLGCLIALLHGGRGVDGTPRRPLYSFRALAVLLAVSIPIGLVLAAISPD